MMAPVEIVAGLLRAIREADEGPPVLGLDLYRAAREYVGEIDPDDPRVFPEPELGTGGAPASPQSEWVEEPRGGATASIEPPCAAGAYNLGLEVAARLVSPTPHVEEERSCAAVAEQILALRTKEPSVPDLAAALGEPAVSRGLLAEALELLRRWGSAEDCECPPEGHFCGRPYYERLVASIEAALSAPDGKLAGDLLRTALVYYLAANTVEDKVDPWGKFEDAADAFLAAFPTFGKETR